MHVSHMLYDHQSRAQGCNPYRTDCRVLSTTYRIMASLWKSVIHTNVLTKTNHLVTGTFLHVAQNKLMTKKWKHILTYTLGACGMFAWVYTYIAEVMQLIVAMDTSGGYKTCIMSL